MEHIGTWTWFDHTADIGLSVSAPSLPSLFATAATALFDLLIESEPTPAEPPLTQRTLTIRADDSTDLLVRWLAELLYLHETEQLIFRQLTVTDQSEQRLVGIVSWEVFDDAYHRVRREIKGITYHQACVEKTSTGWQARLVLDV